MKKLYYLLTTIALVGCSEKSDPIVDVEEQAVQIVDAEIGVEMSSNITRAFLGSATLDDDKIHYTIVHQFESGDNLYIADYSGEYPFSVQKDGQSTTLKGKWAKPSTTELEKNKIFATFPSTARRSQISKSDGNPLIQFTLPTGQETRIKETTEKKHVTYDTRAGLAVACADNKSYGLWFIPVVSYLYFYSESPTCIVESEVGISGNYDVVYTGSYGTGTNAGDGSEYNTAEGLMNHLNFTASSKKIECEGKYIEGHKNAFIGKGYPEGKKFYEYVVCIKPGTYTAGQLKIKLNDADSGFKNQEAITLTTSYVYYMGCID